MKALGLIVIGMVLVGGCKVTTGNVNNVPLPKASDVVDTISRSGQYATFLGALQKTGLNESLRGEGPFTVFVPTQAAWDKLPADKVNTWFLPGHEVELRRVVSNHIVPGRLTASDLAERNWVVNVNGTTLPIRRAGLDEFIDGAKIVTPYIECSNGTLNIIDSVILE